MPALAPFTPAGTATIAVTAASASVALPKVSTCQVMVTAVAGGGVSFINFGRSSVTAALTDTPILPGTVQVFTLPSDVTHAAAISATTATLYFTIGDGQ